MKTEYINKNIAFIGDFKPSMFDKLYFIKRGVIREDEFLDNSIFTPSFTNIITSGFSIRISDTNIHFIFRDVNQDISFEKIVSSLNGLKVKGFGFNFKRVFFLENFNETRNLFRLENNPLNKFFNDDSTAYGYYISKDYLDSRLKLDIKPVTLERIDNAEVFTALDFDFNFHFDNSDYVTKLRNYKNYELLTLNIINSYE